MENIDAIYENFPPEKLKTKVSVNLQKRCQTSRCVIVCLGLLCAILLAGNIGLIVIYELRANHDCEVGWTKFNGSCYIVSSGKKQWEESKNDCKIRGADLVTIKSKEEKAFVNGLLRSQERAWIGFTKRKIKEREPVTTTFWQPKQYHLLTKNGWICAEFQQTSSNGRENRVLCSSSKVWICEKNMMNMG